MFTNSCVNFFLKHNNKNTRYKQNNYVIETVKKINLKILKPNPFEITICLELILDQGLNQTLVQTLNNPQQYLFIYLF